MISFIIPTIGRDSLGRTLQSIESWGDEILVEVDSPPSKRWGNDQRNKAMKRAKGDYLAFMDDDDWYVKGHREMMEQAIKENQGKPILFKVEYPNGDTLWKEKNIEPGNVTTQMILVPNEPEKLYHWKDGRNMADQIFIANWKFKEIAWIDKVIAKMGHDYE